jgi:hypothetical protein
VNNKKPRGSLVGLKENREALKVKNTDAMLKVIEHLGKEKPDALWSYKEIWSGAGLKSNVALNSPWNAHVRDAIDAHNSSIREASELEVFASTQKNTLRVINRELRKQVEVMRNERDQALSKIAIYEAEADFYKRKCEGLLRVNERLRSGAVGLSIV